MHQFDQSLLQGVSLVMPDDVRSDHGPCMCALADCPAACRASGQQTMSCSGAAIALRQTSAGPWALVRSALPSLPSRELTTLACLQVPPKRHTI